MSASDLHHMAQALMLARRGLGQTWPNPSVGTVIANTSGDILGRGQTAPGGRPHAEAVALEQAGKRTKGATLYVTLEPCAHVGRGAPCADAIANAKPARVVAAMRDPDAGLFTCTPALDVRAHQQGSLTTRLFQS